jgi:ribose transport system substrate-binding protein
VVAALGTDSATKVIGWDLTAEVIAGLDSGTVVGVVQQDPYQEGIEGVNEIFALLNGAMAKGFIDVPIAVITTENVEPYRAIFPAG